MNNKERFIKAIKDTKESHESIDDCLLCEVANKDTTLEDCIPCPLARDDGWVGCILAGMILDWPKDKKAKDRVGYYKRVVIKILEETPVKYFTEKGWRFNKLLHNYIEKQYNKIYGR